MLEGNNRMDIRNLKMKTLKLIVIFLSSMSVVFVFDYIRVVMSSYPVSLFSITIVFFLMVALYFITSGLYEKTNKKIILFINVVCFFLLFFISEYVPFDPIFKISVLVLLGIVILTICMIYILITFKKNNPNVEKLI